jgi:hypothetical protein
MRLRRSPGRATRGRGDGRAGRTRLGRQGAFAERRATSEADRGRCCCRLTSRSILPTGSTRWRSLKTASGSACLSAATGWRALSHTAAGTNFPKQVGQVGRIGVRVPAPCGGVPQPDRTCTSRLSAHRTGKAMNARDKTSEGPAVHQTLTNAPGLRASRTAQGSKGPSSPDLDFRPCDYRNFVARLGRHGAPRRPWRARPPRRGTSGPQHAATRIRYPNEMLTIYSD